MNDPLAELRDIHLPDPVSWWPIASGWWICLALAILLVLASIFFYQKVWKKRRYRRLALHELEQLMASDAESEKTLDATALEAIAGLIRRTALASASHAGIARMQGQQWQEYLQQHMPENEARLIAVSRFQPAQTVDKEALYKAARQWIREHKP